MLEQVVESGVTVRDVLRRLYTQAENNPALLDKSRAFLLRFPALPLRRLLVEAVQDSGLSAAQALSLRDWLRDTLNIDVLTNSQITAFQANGWWPRNIGDRPLCCKDARPGDYAHDLARGTVDHVADWHSYSFHRVNIPAGAVISGRNFCQIVPSTEAIIVVGLPDVMTFVDCNLVNCALHAGWIVQGCNTSQSWLVKTGVDENGNDIEERQWLCSHPDQLTPAMLIPPASAITSRVF